MGWKDRRSRNDRTWMTAEEEPRQLRRDRLAGVLGLVLFPVALALCIWIRMPDMFQNVYTLRIDLNDYLQVDFSGYDGYGTAAYTFQYDQFRDDYADDLLVKGEIPDGEDPCAYFAETYCTGSLSSTGGLSNGEDVTFHWDTDTAAAEELYNVELSCEDSTFRVSGLGEIRTLDPFENIDVRFSGIAPLGEATLLSGASSYDSWVSYTLDRDSGLSNGDTVTVTISPESFSEQATEALKQEGIVLDPSAAQKTFTVEGLSSYVTSLDQLRAAADSFTQTVAGGETEVRDRIASLDPYFYTVTVDAAAYDGCLYFTTKDYAQTQAERDAGDYTKYFNILYLIYRVDCSFTGEDGSAGSATLYLTAQTKDFTAGPDGTIEAAQYFTASNPISFQSPDGGGYEVGLIGYGTKEELVDAVLAENADAYNSESALDG